MKITILTNDFLPSVGGIEIFTKLIAEEMALRGHQISIVTNTPNKNKKDIGLFSIYRKNNFYSKFKVFKNSDLIIAIFLLCFSGIMINDASNIRDLGFEGMKADAWPRVVLWMLVVMSSVMLGKSYFQFKTENHKDKSTFKINFSKFKKHV